MEITPTIRAAVNAGMAPPNPLNLLYAVYTTPADTLADTNRVISNFVRVLNPAIPGVNGDAGHALARQNESCGHIATHVFPKNRTINRGWGGTFGQWRQHEVNFHNGVAAYGFGRWRIG